MTVTHELAPRLFERVDVGGIPVDWDVRTGRRLWQRRTTWREALVVDVSVGGAQMIVPNLAEYRPGRRVVIGAERSLGTVIIRWTRNAPHPSVMVCGVSYEELEPHLASYLMQPLTKGPKPPAEEWWGSEGWRLSAATIRAVNGESYR